jgi:MATE family multidrug resistance protein
MRFGVPNGIYVALDTLAFTVFYQLVGRLGPVDLAATSIAFTLNLFAFLPVMGIGQAVEVLVGQRLGENRPDEAERSTWTGMLVALACTFAVALLYLAVPAWLAWPFRSNTEDAAQWEAIQLLVPLLLRFVAVYCLFDAVGMVISNALRGAGDTRFVTAISLSLAWPVMVGPTYWCLRAVPPGETEAALYRAWGFASLYIVVLALTFLGRFLQGRWRSMRVIAESSSGESAQLPLSPKPILEDNPREGEAPAEPGEGAGKGQHTPNLLMTND